LSQKIFKPRLIRQPLVWIALLALLTAGLYLFPSHKPVKIDEKTSSFRQHRRSPVILRALAATRIPPPAATNPVNPFVSLLGPGATTYIGSMASLRELPAVLSSNQVETLRALVAIPHNPAGALSPLEFNGIKNVAADILLQQPAFPAEFLADLVVQQAAPSQDEVWRDYCLQMLTSGYLNLSSRQESDPDAPAARELALHTLMNATTAGGSTWPGTALLGLNTILDAEPSAFPREELDSRILAIISDPSSSEAALITASRLAGMSHLASARPALEALAKDSGSELVRAVAAKSLSELSEEKTTAADRAVTAISK
jgi:hypothetical protein